MKIEFEQDKRLLKSVISRQAGEMEKGFIELVQNAIDARRGMDRGEVVFTINKESNILMVMDNGKGMTHEEIMTYFRTFGLSSKDEADLGEFGMGRGQVMTMVYDVEEDQMVGSIEVRTKTAGGKTHRIFNIDVPTLTFEVEETEDLGMEHGTTWILTHLNHDHWNSDDIRHYLRRTVRYAPIDISVILNDGADVFKMNKDVEDGDNDILVETKDFIIATGSDYYNMKFYERGLFVKNLNFPGIDGIIISKSPVKLNFARNDPVENDPMWKEIMKRLDEEIIKLLMITPDGEVGADKAQMVACLLVKMSGTGDDLFAPLAGKKVFQDVRGKLHSWLDLKKQERVYLNGTLSNGSFQQKSGHIVLMRNRELNKLIHKEDVNVGPNEDITEDTYNTKPNVSHKYETAMDWLQRFCPDRPLKWGKSPGNKAFTDGRTIWFDHDHYKESFALFSKSRVQFFARVVRTLAHELTHEDSTIYHHHHDGYFWEEMTKNIQNLWVRLMKMQYPKSDFSWGCEA